jgi:hypothetical protein
VRSIAVSLRRPQPGCLEGLRPQAGPFILRGSPREHLGMTGRTLMPLEGYDSRISNSRRPSVFSSFFTALEAITSPWLA